MIILCDVKQCRYNTPWNNERGYCANRALHINGNGMCSELIKPYPIPAETPDWNKRIMEVYDVEEYVDDLPM